MTTPEQIATQAEAQAKPSIDDYPHTRRSLQIETGVVEKTVRRWIEKAGVTGHKFGNVERFTDAHRDQILSHQSKPKAEEVVEAELIEPGAIELHIGNTGNAAPLVEFNLQPVNIELPAIDLDAMQQQTQQLEQAAQDGANALAAYFGARLDVGIAQIAAEQDNLLQGIRAQALNVAATKVSGGNGQQ
ncbi:MAG: hypothetical protein AAGB19_15395 [Cyanobacteria bacterium P01_F01_bin.3]